MRVDGVFVKLVAREPWFLYSHTLNMWTSRTGGKEGGDEARGGADGLHQEEARIRGAYARRTDRGRYSWSNPGHLFAMQERERRVLRLLASRAMLPLEDKFILDVGCGTGQWLRDFEKWGARPGNLFGVDLLPDRIAEGRDLCPPMVTLECASAATLNHPENRFDLVVQSTVFTSILDPIMRRAVAAEMVRVLRPGGMILWYDYHVNNPRNPDVRGVGRREIADLFPGCVITLSRITLAPPLARILAPRAWILCHLLERIPCLCTHYLGAVSKPRTSVDPR